MTYRPRHIFIVAILFLITIHSYSQVQDRDDVQDKVYTHIENDYLSDTTTEHKTTGINKDNVYKRMISSKSGFVRNFANIIMIGGDPSFRGVTYREQIGLSENYYKDFEGLTIDSILINSKEIFYREDSLSTGSWLERTIDKIHIKTKNRIISKYILFHEGDPVKPLQLATTEYILRHLPFLATAYILIRHDDLGGVVLTISTTDNWSILPTGELGDYPQLTLFDQNFLGLGDKLSVTYFHPGKSQGIGGQVEFLKRNIWGKFIDADIKLGGGNRNNIAYVSATRDYMYPGDFFWNIEGGYTEKGKTLLTMDTSYFSKKISGDLYFGKTFHASKKDESLFTYVSGGIDGVKYLKAPYTTKLYNPYYDSQIVFGAKVGIAKQHFFQSNMIYEYGIIEDIPYGFRFEMIGGYGYSKNLGQFEYIGGQARYGFYREKLGFMDLTLKGSIKHVNEQSDWQSGAIDLNVKYFTPLKSLGRGFYNRTFVNLNHTQGFRRLIGEREVLNYNSSYARIRGISTPIVRLGEVRTNINLESVFFMPLYFLHFRFAGFVWGDFGWLGDNPCFWKNYFCSSTGIGIRIKNERLVINNIEIRLGIALRKFPERGFSMFEIGNESRYNIENYSPIHIGEYDYK